MKNVKFRGMPREKKANIARFNSAAQNRGKNPNYAVQREIPRPAETSGPTDEQQIDSFFVKHRYFDR